LNIKKKHKKTNTRLLLVLVEQLEFFYTRHLCTMYDQRCPNMVLGNRAHFKLLFNQLIWIYNAFLLFLRELPYNFEGKVAREYAFFIHAAKYHLKTFNWSERLKKWKIWPYSFHPKKYTTEINIDFFYIMQIWFFFFMWKEILARGSQKPHMLKVMVGL
jgi:hypothetical protein